MIITSLFVDVLFVIHCPAGIVLIAIAIFASFISSHIKARMVALAVWVIKLIENLWMDICKFYGYLSTNFEGWPERNTNFT